MIQQPTCLLIEDEELLREMLTECLEEGGFLVVFAEDGATALRLIDSDGAAFAAIVTDVRLPGADGWQIARHAREVFTDIPVVYMSGDSASSWSVEGVPNSMMLQKPFAMAQLVTGLATLLNNVPATGVTAVA